MNRKPIVVRIGLLDLILLRSIGVNGLTFNVGEKSSISRIGSILGVYKCAHDCKEEKA